MFVVVLRSNDIIGFFLFVFVFLFDNDVNVNGLLNYVESINYIVNLKL